MSVVEVDFGVNPFDQLFEGQFETISVFSLEEDPFDSPFAFLNADKDGSSFRIQKGYHCPQHIPLDFVVSNRNWVVVAL